jgi:hypothetical protein
MEYILIRHGGKHDWFQNPRNQSVAARSDANDRLAKTSSKQFLMMHESNAHPAACPDADGSALQLRGFVGRVSVSVTRRMFGDTFGGIRLRLFCPTRALYREISDTK